MNNMVIIRPDKENDRYESSHMSFRIDTSYNPQYHYPRTGTVIVVPELKYRNDGKEDGLSVDVPMELEVGDKVWFDYMNMKEPKWAGTNIMVDYDQVFAYERGGVQNRVVGLCSTYLFMRKSPRPSSF